MNTITGSPKVDRPLTESPFSLSEMKVINASRSWARTTSLCLKIGVIACIIFSGTSFLSLIHAQNMHLASGLAATIFVVAGVATVVSFLATGFFPHWTSDAHNDCQDLIGRAKDDYQNEAIKLIRLYYQDRTKCFALVGTVEPDQLTRSLHSIIRNPFQTEAVIARLREAIRFIKTQEPLTDEVLLLAQRTYSLDEVV